MTAGLATLALVVGSTAVAAEPEMLTGKVVGVADGDSLTLLVGREQLWVRLQGIDAPQRGQAFRTRAREALAELVHEKTVTVRSTGTDRHGPNPGAGVHPICGPRDDRRERSIRTIRSSSQPRRPPERLVGACGLICPP